MPTEDSQERSQLFRERSFWGLTCTQFLGAFNDNLYKQLMLLLAIATPTIVVVGEAPETGSDVQGWAAFVFSLPFVLFSGFAGYLSDKYSKTPIIVLCKVAEIVIMFMGMLAFLYFEVFGQWGTWVVLFLMGTQSSFFGPGKYGILPELFPPHDLARANGIILMTTFLAIIFGIVLAGGLYDVLVGDSDSTENLWRGLIVCVGIAVIGTLTSLLVRRVPAAQPGSKLTMDCWGVSNEVRNMLTSDRPLLIALCVSSVFWMVAGLAAPTVNRLGLEMLAVNKTQTSLLTASIGIGIMIGALAAGWLCRGGHGDRLVTIGLWGIFLSLLSLGFWKPNDEHLLGFSGSVVALIALGVFAAVYSIPLQVFLQERPPSNLKGRLIATMNQANFVGILLAGPLYQGFESLARGCNWPVSSVFWMTGLLVLPLAAFYRLRSQAETASIVANR
ncbi:MAG: MFS transporter [Planctomycetales bacterium]|nr:MFS transporter [Planctomycetales bacterium]